MKACCKAFLDEQFEGDADLINELYEVYCASMEEKLAAIEESAGRREWEAVDRSAHAVKGNALAVGDTEMAEEAVALRGAAKLGDAQQAQGCISRMKEIAAGL